VADSREGLAIRLTACASAGEVFVIKLVMTTIPGIVRAINKTDIIFSN